ncbi:hypothetical protein K3495_g700 [Podosphaera aphanis]|nr:hypothetical protein K3495_g700 [Podosphaera aphanis]
MDEPKGTERTAILTTLRAELKAWEKAFAAANKGQKASRDDIKKNPAIAAKYKEYNKIRELHADKITSDSQPAPQHHTPRRRKLDDVTSHGSNKRQQYLLHTPSQENLSSWNDDDDVQESRSVVRNLFSSSKRSLAPTPQKDGHVLGLFDLLSDSKITSPLGEHRSTTTTRPVLSTSATMRIQPEAKPQSEVLSPSKKQRTSDSFATPVKKLVRDADEAKTPRTATKLHLSTPSFLRRIQPPQEADMEKYLELSPRVKRIKQKPLMKGLSSILADLRDIQDERLDEDLEALREMEAGESGLIKPLAQPSFKPITLEKDILKPDSQAGLLIGGLDDETALGSPTGMHEHPVKLFKKQGQKRTTRKSNLKPSRAKLAPVQEEATSEDNSEEHNALTSDKPKIGGDEFGKEARNFDSDSQSEYTASEGETRYRRPKQENKSLPAQTAGNSKSSVRKVSAKAHQNFKRLKLRNSGASGPMRNSRYRRKK